MKKKWKRLSALCLAALFILMMPVSAIKAADNNSNLPTIELKYQGIDIARYLTDAIEYNQYINNHSQSISISVSQGSLASLSYYLDESGNTGNKSEEQLNSLSWQPLGNLNYQEVPLNKDGKYVLYVKAVSENNQGTMYIKTIGMVVDTIAPVIKAADSGAFVVINDGDTWPLGTKFLVEDDNLAAVSVNEQNAVPDGEGMYQVAANGNSCVIKAVDKAGNQTTRSITINGEGGKPGGDDPKDDTTVINKGGTYSLKAGAAYRLGSGSWTLEGDSSVYSGGITFYVNKDGDYSFKRQ